jgi:hypothetical protein
MYDSVYVFAKALAAVDRGHVLWPANLSCDLEQPWKDGLTLYNYISSVSNDYKLVLLYTKRQGKVGHHDFVSRTGDCLFEFRIHFSSFWELLGGTGYTFHCYIPPANRLL